MNRYDDKAFFDAYAQMSRSLQGLSGAGEWAQLRALFPDVHGKDVLDIGCGYGWHCRYAKELGAHSVIGIDESERMIARAKEMDAGSGVEYRVCSLQDYAYPKETFDAVISNLVLHYVEDIDSVFRDVYRALRPGGTFLFNIEHPVFTAGVKQKFLPDGTWPVADYFYPGTRETEFLGFTVIKQHHTLTQIMSGLLHAGFLITAVEEAMPPEEWRAQMPEEMSRPMMLLIRAEKGEK